MLVCSAGLGFLLVDSVCVVTRDYDQRYLCDVFNADCLERQLHKGRCVQKYRSQIIKHTYKEYVGSDLILKYKGNSQGSEIKMHDRRYDHTKQTKAYALFKFCVLSGIANFF